MFRKVVLAGTVDVSVVVRFIDATDGTPETGVDHATSGIDMKYRREGAANVDITEAALAALTTAHTDGGMEQIGNGYVRVDLPDAACAAEAGVTGVLVHGVATGMVVIGCYVDLVRFNPYDVVRMGLTALPNAAADAAGGLVISDAGGLDADAQRADVAAILVDTGTTLDGRIPAALVGGRMDSSVGAMAANVITAAATAADFSTEVNAAPLAILGTPAGASMSADIAAVKTDTAAIKAKTDNLPSDPADQSLIIAATDAIIADTNDIQTRLPAALVGGRIDASVGAMAANTLTASAVAADAVTEIQAGLATPTNITAGTITTVTNLTNAPTAGDLTATMKTSVTTAATAATPALSAAGVDAILDDTIGDGTLTMRQTLRVLVAGMAGKLSGAATTTITIRNVADSANVVVATVDADGNRSAVTVTP